MEIETLVERIGWVAFGPGTEQGTPELQKMVEDAVRAVLGKAHVYGVCETCGGSRLIPVPAEKGSGLDAQQAPCPDCGKLSVVTAEVRERAMKAGWDSRKTGFTWEGMENANREIWGELVDAVLSTVLGKVRVARKVLVVETTSASYAAPGDTIALLEADDE